MKPVGDVLRRSNYVVDSIPLGMGRELVDAHHYSHSSSHAAIYRHGLFHVENPLDCLGFALWINATPGTARSVLPEDWQKVLVLSRLVIEPGMPTNAASFLLSRSIKLIRTAGKYRALVTYADQAQGHTGAIYRATNWTYEGLKPAAHPTYVDADGRQVSRKSGPKTRSRSEMESLGYMHMGRSAKHKFVLILDRRIGRKANG